MKVGQVQRLVKTAQKMNRNIEQIFIDCASWNENARKPDMTPIDPDPDGRLRKAQKMLRDFVAEAQREGLA